MPLDDDDDERAEFRPPLPPADRVWRHPSELTSGFTASGTTERSVRFGLGVVVLAALAGAAAAIGVLAVTGSLGERDNTPAQATSASATAVDAVEMAGQTRRSVAEVEATSARQQVLGSAVVFRSDGYLLTSSRSIDGADQVRVVLPDHRDLAATVTGSDPITGVAVLHVTAARLSPAPLSTSDRLRVGDVALTVGADTELDQGQVTRGVVSGLGRRVTGNGGTLHGLIGIDRPVPPSSDGGALVDHDGKVAGICLWVGETSEEPYIGYAVPIEVAREVADDIIATGHARHPWLGISGADLSPDDAADLGLIGGARVTEVTPASPANRAGVHVGDVITRLDGKALGSMSALIAGIREYRPGATVGIDLLRAGKRHSLRIHLTEQPGD